MGYAPEIWNLISWKNLKDDDDDQSYYTHLYLDEQIRVGCYNLSRLQFIWFFYAEFIYIIVKIF